MRRLRSVDDDCFATIFFAAACARSLLFFTFSGALTGRADLDVDDASFGERAAGFDEADVRRARIVSSCFESEVICFGEADSEEPVLLLRLRLARFDADRGDE